MAANAVLTPTHGPNRPRHGTGTAAGCHSDRERECKEGEGKEASKKAFMFLPCVLCIVFNLVSLKCQPLNTVVLSFIAMHF